MTETDQLLWPFHQIANPCEELRRQAAAIAGDAFAPAAIRQATADLAATVEHLFEIAHYIMKSAGPISVDRI